METQPESKVEAAKIRRLTLSYLIIDKELYKRGYSTPYLWCITHSKIQRAMRETHEWVVVCHQGTRYIMQKTLILGHY